MPGASGALTSDANGEFGGESGKNSVAGLGGAPDTAKGGGAAANSAAGAGGTAGGGGSAAGASSNGGSRANGGSAGATYGNCSGAPPTSALIGWAAVAGSGVTTTSGGGSQPVTVVTTLADLNSAAAGTQARVIYVRGAIRGTVIVGSNKTIVGTCAASITGGVHFNKSQNVIFRNLRVVGLNCSDSPADCSGGEDAVAVNASHHLFFDHLDVSDGSDGNLDINEASDFITVSWSKFSYSSARSDPVNGASGHRFSNLIGASDSSTSDAGHLNVTFHHDWWADHVDQRMPRVRFGKVHVFNSLYTAAGNSYCVGVGVSASVRLENDVFIGVQNPVDSSKYSNSSSSLSAVGNVYTNTTAAGMDLGQAFAPPYAYTLDAAADVEALLRSGAGPHD